MVLNIKMVLILDSPPPTINLQQYTVYSTQQWGFGDEQKVNNPNPSSLIRYHLTSFSNWALPWRQSFPDPESPFDFDSDFRLGF
jgi:hypothetical protein